MPWPREKAHAWYSRQPWMLGFNYVPSTAGNTTELWQADTFDLPTIQREVGWAQSIGYNAMRLFVQYLVWKADPIGLSERFDQVLAIAAAKGISVVPVLFDDCAFGDPPLPDPYLGKQKEPTPGMILPSWTPSPGRKLGLDPAERPMLARYVQEFIGTCRTDPRILFWDLFNEPMNHAKVGDGSFITDAFGWARAAEPTQPITVGTFNNENPQFNDLLYSQSDLLTFHAYTDAAGLRAAIEALKPRGYPIICTEWMARFYKSSFETDLPVFRDAGVGCFQWGLVNGRTQCQFPWHNKPGDSVHELGWFHDILHPDGSPYRPAEIGVISTMAGSRPSS